LFFLFIFQNKQNIGLPAELCVLVVLLSDDYYKPKRQCDNHAALRFFQIIKMLPYELQMILVNMVYEDVDKMISCKDFNEALVVMIHKEK
jgi:hypothetical protein